MGILLAVAILAVFAGLLAWSFHWSNRQEEQRQARQRMIYSARADEHYFGHPADPWAATTPVEKPPALTAPSAPVDWRNDDHVDHHAAEGVAAAQFMLDKLWTQKGHGR